MNVFNANYNHNQLDANGNHERLFIYHSERSASDQFMYSLKTSEKCVRLLSERTINENGYSPFDLEIS